MDPSLELPRPGPRQVKVKVKAAGLLTYNMGVVDQYGVAAGQLDPVIGMVPMDKSGIAFSDILTISVWRKIDWLKLVVAMLFPVPLAVLGAALVVLGTVGGLVLAVPFAMISAWMLYRAIGIRINRVRVVAAHRTLDIRFDTPIWNRKEFHDELLRRAGLPPAAIP